MPKKAIVTLPNNTLRHKAEEVRAEDIASAGIQRLISDMKEILAKAPDGVGLAAPQVGAGLRIFLVSEEAAVIGSQREKREALDSERKRKVWKYFVFINPVLKKQSRSKIKMAEGCLSVPGKFGEIGRSEKVFLAWRDEAGKKHERGFTKFFARVIQHETDHLDGTLIVDRAKRIFEMANSK